jgi:mono/diheme cytochrome c family protein
MRTQIAGRLAIALGAMLASSALADTAAPPVMPADPFAQTTGADIYKGVCQGCHMPDAKGASGAGAYPALARDNNLEIAAYPVGVVLKGQKAMPGFGEYFSDEQIANVVNYIRTSFGNHYRGKVTPADVKAMR